MNKNLRLTLGLTAAAASSAGALMTAPAQAQTNSGPGLDATRNLTINAATTFNNSYGTSFEATGDLTGTAAFADPVSTTANLNSGTAFVSAMVSFEGGSAGVLAGVSGLSNSIDTTGSQGITRNSSTIAINGGGNSVLGTVNPVGLVINGAGSSSTVGGSFIGTNIGTEVLQVGGSMSEVIVNELSAF
jgi:hypothetical protein